MQSLILCALALLQAASAAEIPHREELHAKLFNPNAGSGGLSCGSQSGLLNVAALNSYNCPSGGSAYQPPFNPGPPAVNPSPPGPPHGGGSTPPDPFYPPHGGSYPPYGGFYPPYFPPGHFGPYGNMPEPPAPYGPYSSRTDPPLTPRGGGFYPPGHFGPYGNMPEPPAPYGPYSSRTIPPGTVTPSGGGSAFAGPPLYRLPTPYGDVPFTYPPNGQQPPIDPFPFGGYGSGGVVLPPIDPVGGFPLGFGGGAMNGGIGAFGGGNLGAIAGMGTFGGSAQISSAEESSSSTSISSSSGGLLYSKDHPKKETKSKAS